MNDKLKCKTHGVTEESDMTERLNNNKTRKSLIRGGKNLFLIEGGNSVLERIQKQTFIQ